MIAQPTTENTAFAVFSDFFDVFDVFDVFPFVYARPALIKLLPFCGFSVHIVPVVAAIIGRGFGIIITHCIC